MPETVELAGSMKVKVEFKSDIPGLPHPFSTTSDFTITDCTSNEYERIIQVLESELESIRVERSEPNA